MVPIALHITATHFGIKLMSSQHVEWTKDQLILLWHSCTIGKTQPSYMYIYHTTLHFTSTCMSCVNFVHALTFCSSGYRAGSHVCLHQASTWPARGILSTVIFKSHKTLVVDVSSLRPGFMAYFLRWQPSS